MPFWKDEEDGDGEDPEDSFRFPPPVPRETWLGEVAAMPDGQIFSPRVEKIIDVVRTIRSEARGEKILVVSRFVKFLDVLQEAIARKAEGDALLRVERTSFTGYVGGEERAERLRVFNYTAGGPMILFLSLTTGGTGLNIARASWVILCEPCWAPGQEAQVKGRVDRLGQTRVPHVYHVVANPCAIDSYIGEKVRRPSSRRR